MGLRTTGKRARLWAVYMVSALMLVVIVSCSPTGDGVTTASGLPGAGSTASPSAVPNADPSEGPEIDWKARIVSNEQAGKISYMTGFNYAASSPDINAVVADELGYFKKLGLDVEIIPGVDPEGIKMLSAGRVQFAGAGSASLVIQSVANDAEIKGIALMSAVGLGALMVLDGSGIETVKDLEGKTVGYKGALPAHFKAMFINGDADISKIKLASVGFDPTILNTADVDAVTIFKSNEPIAMNKLGFNVRLLDPEDYGVTTSFGVVAANSKFIANHPTAAEDFLRAVFKAHEYIVANPDKAVSILKSRSETSYNVETELSRLRVELDIIAASHVAGTGIGWQAEEQWRKEIDLLVNTNSIEQALRVDQVMDNQFISSIYNGEELIWPQ